MLMTPTVLVVSALLHGFTLFMRTVRNVVPSFVNCWRRRALKRRDPVLIPTEPHVLVGIRNRGPG